VSVLLARFLLFGIARRCHDLKAVDPKCMRPRGPTCTAGQVAIVFDLLQWAGAGSSPSGGVFAAPGNAKTLSNHEKRVSRQRRTTRSAPAA